MAMDDILRFETLPADFARLADRLGFPAVSPTATARRAARAPPRIRRRDPSLSRRPLRPRLPGLRLSARRIAPCFELIKAAPGRAGPTAGSGALAGLCRRRDHRHHPGRYPAGPAQSEWLFLAFCLALVGRVVAVRLGARSFAGLVESGLCQARIRIAEKSVTPS